ncbi:DUF3368 domain-containing protein [Roseofilum sp. BLCC_M91]|uniref:DUF3368 domain-containing protein n=1 Tax=Roseofilum halophilum BLCC-M91 TaxID=3022259 RepID=A0ABT7BIN3_9CYAN|nr:DUF3368 domain-containing protein [Roseofilum halophilum]MDJ1179054.1 DUF3368 domain-containing protein [Roseofilum halophilum BLCC-M91]
MIVISDTSPITNLAAIGQLDLLRQLYNHVIIPVAVYNEMVGIGKVVPGTEEVQTLPWIQTQAVANGQQVAMLQGSRENIDLGEAEAIALALEMNTDLVLMDERRGRALAEELGLNVVGLLGILVQAKNNDFITEVKPLMDRLIQEVDFRISPDLYRLILQLAGE